MIKHLQFSYNGQYPIIFEKLPDRIRLSNGLTITDKDNFTLENLRDAGYIVAPTIPDYNCNNEKLIWNGSDWEVVSLTDSELDNIKQEYVNIMIEEINIEINECNNLIFNSGDDIDTVEKEGLDADYVTAMKNYITTLNTLKDTTFPNADDPFSLKVPNRPEE
jgi:hypothetical protein